MDFNSQDQQGYGLISNQWGDCSRREELEAQLTELTRKMERVEERNMMQGIGQSGGMYRGDHYYDQCPPFQEECSFDNNWSQGDMNQVWGNNHASVQLEENRDPLMRLMLEMKDESSQMIKGFDRVFEDQGKTIEEHGQFIKDMQQNLAYVIQQYDLVENAKKEQEPSEMEEEPKMLSSFDEVEDSQEHSIGKKSFASMVILKLEALEAKMDTMAQKNEKIIQTKLKTMEKNIGNRFEECLKAYEERSIKRFEEYSEKITPMLKMLESRTSRMHDRLDALHFSTQMVDYHVGKVEQRVEQINYEMLKAQGKIVESDSDDDFVDCAHLLDELPGFVGESIEEDARNDSVEMTCEPSPPMSCAHDENERMLCEDIASLRGGAPTVEVIHVHSMAREGMGERQFMACSPVEEIECSIGPEPPLPQEVPSRSPRLLPCYSCEMSCDPQVKACFEALASSSAKEELHEDLSWEEIDPVVDFELQKRKCKKESQVVAQVWIPKGTLEVMNVFHVREINLGDKLWVPHKAKKRKRRKTPSSPQGGVG